MSEFEGKDVLLVDDDDDIIETLEAALEELGVNIRCTGNGNEARRRCPRLHQNVDQVAVMHRVVAAHRADPTRTLGFGDRRESL